ncbi:Aluminum-activated malate transporter 8 [Vitis vinifera]|uniref:Aluminum-activated malate transporter 8 n=1 Tax=Vitis vinifera TaxID=29760 RepID=A0A438FF09_VITVI|nr:Aluminum-activated malate transporter 8 [Vitis vinifera]
MNIQGYTIGNPITNHFSDFNSRIAYTHQVGILSYELYEGLPPKKHSENVIQFGICNGLSSTILISSTTAVFVSIGICPMWAGDDLHKLVAGNVEKLGNFLEGFSGEYFRVLGDGESKDSKTFLQGYKSILTSKIIEDSLPELRIVDEKNMEEEHKVVLSGKAGEVDYLHSLHGQIGKPKANVFTRAKHKVELELCAKKMPNTSMILDFFKGWEKCKLWNAFREHMGTLNR